MKPPQAAASKNSRSGLKPKHKKDKKDRTREPEFWLEASSTRDSWYGMKPPKTAFPVGDYDGNDDPNADTVGMAPKFVLAKKVKETYLREKIPGDLVLERNRLLAERADLRANQKLILQRRRRREEQLLRMRKKRSDNWKREERASSGGVRREKPESPQREVRKPTNERKLKDWR